MVCFKFALLVVAVTVSTIATVHGRPTHCERHKGDSEFRCAKDTYRADSIHIRNIADKTVNFQAHQWLTVTGSKGIKYASHEYTLLVGESVDIAFDEVGPDADTYRELFIVSCKIGGQNRDCLYAVSPCPKN